MHFLLVVIIITCFIEMNQQTEQSCKTCRFLPTAFVKQTSHHKNHYPEKDLHFGLLLFIYFHRAQLLKHYEVLTFSKNA